VLAERVGLDAGLYSYFGEAFPRPDLLLVEPLHIVSWYAPIGVERIGCQSPRPINKCVYCP
jgi:hypothetical protein